MSPKVRLWFFAVLFLLLAGCGPPRAGEIAWRNPEVDLVWPEPPETARIRFLRTLEPADFAQVSGSADKFFRWITGEQKRILPLVTPFGVAANGRGRIWVTDTGLPAVHAFDLTRNRVEYIVAAGKEPLVSPVGVAYDDRRDRLYVSDSVLKKVMVFSGRGDFLESLDTPGGFGRPAGMAVDEQGNLYVADVLEGRVEVFGPDGVHRKTLASGASPEEGFNRPICVVVDRSGRVYVTDSMNFRVEILGPDGESLGTIGQIGDVPGSFARPRGVAVDSEGHIYVADAAFGNIQIFDLAGRLLLFFGELGKEPGQFSLPAGLFFDHNDHLYAVDAYNQRIQIFEYLPHAGQD